MKITIYGKTSCEYCQKALELAPNAIYINLDNNPALKNIFRQRGFTTVPVVFVDTPEGNVYIGGYEELKDYVYSQKEYLDGTNLSDSQES